MWVTFHLVLITDHTVMEVMVDTEGMVHIQEGTMDTHMEDMEDMATAVIMATTAHIHQQDHTQRDSSITSEIKFATHFHINILDGSIYILLFIIKI